MHQDTSTAHQPFVIEWRQGFRINIGQVDDEHEHLFTLIKALQLGTVEQTINELLEYIVVHFSNEQALMEKSGYPELERHIMLHEDFAGRVADFLDNSEAWNEERVQSLRRFLNKWLVGHILTHDLRFGKWHAEHARPLAVPAAAPVAAPAADAARAQTREARAHRGFFARLFARNYQTS